LINGIHKVTHPASANQLLRLNVGFLLKEGAGYSRDIDFDYPGLLRAEDATINYLHGRVRLTRTPQGILVQGALHARTPVECVRCLKPVDLDFDVELSELFRTSELSPSNGSPLSEDYNVDDGDYIDLTPIVREEALLAVPIQVLCSRDCKGLCAQCGQDLNEGSCGCEADSIDPRLAPLRKLLLDEWRNTD
jgi:uncharacterized protein